MSLGHWLQRGLNHEQPDEVVPVWEQNQCCGSRRDVAPALRLGRHRHRRSVPSQDVFCASKSFSIVGTGVVRHWHSNRQLHYEMDTLRGIPNGRQRLWTETGKLRVEIFYVNGRSVSFSRYRAACKRNPDLAVYSPVSIPRIMRSTRGVTVPRCVLPDEDGSSFWRS
jgi:hypothetical protein